MVVLSPDAEVVGCELTILASGSFFELRIIIAIMVECVKGKGKKRGKRKPPPERAVVFGCVVCGERLG